VSNDPTEKPANFKGFGKPDKPQPPAKKKDQDFGKKDLDKFVEEKGGTAYSVFVRSEAKGRWIPAGTIAAPAERIDEAVTDSKRTLNDNVIKRVPSLKGKTASFEYGYRLLDKPRDPVTVARPVQRSILDKIKGLFKPKG